MSISLPLHEWRGPVLHHLPINKRSPPKRNFLANYALVPLWAGIPLTGYAILPTLQVAEHPADTFPVTEQAAYLVLCACTECVYPEFTP